MAARGRGSLARSSIDLHESVRASLKHLLINIDDRSQAQQRQKQELLASIPVVDEKGELEVNDSGTERSEEAPSRTVTDRVVQTIECADAEVQTDPTVQTDTMREMSNVRSVRFQLPEEDTELVLEKDRQDLQCAICLPQDSGAVNAGSSVVDHQYMQESPRYMVIGVALGMLGFFVAIVPYLIRLFGKSDPLPATISAVVARWETVEARMFFGFEFTAAILVMLSWYPFKLRNAGCIPSLGGCKIGKTKLSWATFRQFAPPLGLMIVATCPTVERKVGQITPAEYLTSFIHTLGAMVSFCSYLLAEAHMLSSPIVFTNVVPLRCDAVGKNKVIQDRKSAEYQARLWTLRLAAGFLIVHLILQVVILLGDIGRVWFLLSFCAEAGICLLIVCNLFVIWYYCHERHGFRHIAVHDEPSVIGKASSTIEDNHVATKASE
eukprot:TRINITY_DN32842_c0_g1_i1.p1 TRINITY_DN32842_c0_g1~~TRINITY_DN32842_c0_g1_i1.p1  ORF type:complete len:437 (+),score=34.57 TRINITY_DN32842_c0_g1_i1:38-1348(+)